MQEMLAQHQKSSRNVTHIDGIYCSTLHQAPGGLTRQILHIYSLLLKHHWERMHATIRQYIECTLLQHRFWSQIGTPSPNAFLACQKTVLKSRKAPQMSGAPSYGVQGTGRVEGPTPLRIQGNNRYPLLWTTGSDGAWLCISPSAICGNPCNRPRRSKDMPGVCCCQ